jgi:hypothetical protein
MQVCLQPRRSFCALGGAAALLRMIVAGLVVFAGAGLAGRPEAGLAASGQASSVLLLGTGANGVYRSVDGGHTWRHADVGLPPGGVWQVQADPTLPYTAYATTGSLYRTTDGGAHWARVPGVQQGGPGITALAAQSTLVLAAGPQAIVEGGGQRRWAAERIAVPGGAPLALLPVGTDLLYAVSRDSRLYLYGNIPWSHGAGWQPLGRDVLGGPITALAAVPLHFSAASPCLYGPTAESCIILYAAVAGHGIYQSVDSGRTWAHESREQDALPATATVRALLTGDGVATAYAGVEGHGLYRSRHSNQFWKQAIGSGQNFTITALLSMGTSTTGATAAGGSGVPPCKATSLAPWACTIVAATAGAGVRLYDYSGDRLVYRGRASGVPDGVLGLSLTQLVTPQPPAPKVPTLPGSTCAYAAGKAFPVCGPFLTFYQSARPATARTRMFGEAISGLTYDRIDKHLIVQYFQRARFEYRPDLPDKVALTPLGTLLSRGLRVTPLSSPLLPERRFAHGYSAGGAFLKFWQQHDGARLIGDPISPAFSGSNGDGSGRSYIMQYFQYARLEYHPELSGTRFTIEVGMLGADYLRCMQTGTYCKG